MDDTFEILFDRSRNYGILAFVLRVRGDLDGAKSIDTVIEMDAALRKGDGVEDAARWLLKEMHTSLSTTFTVRPPEFVSIDGCETDESRIAKILDFLTGPYAFAKCDPEALKLYIAHNYHDCLLGVVRPERAREFLRMISRLGELSTDRPFAATMVELIDEASAYRANLYCSAEPSCEAGPPKK